LRHASAVEAYQGNALMTKPRQDEAGKEGTPRQVLEAINRAILESALDCIISMDAAGVVREFNPAAERVFGYSRAEAVGKQLAELIIPPALRAKHRQGLAHYLKTGEGPVLNRRIEINAQRKDGSEILVELAISPLRIDGAPFFTAYLRDITERVRNDRRRVAQYTVASLLAGSWTLAEASPLVLQAIASTGDWILSAIWLYDEEAKVLRRAGGWHAESEKLEKFAEFSSSIQFRKGEGLPGRVWESEKPAWVHDVTVDTNFPRRPAALEAGLRGAFGFPLFAGRTINGMIELFSENLAEPDPDMLQLVEALGSQIGLFIERRRIEQELQREKENAEAASAAKDRFLAMLSHELRTPLTPVLVWAGEMARERGLGPEMQEGLRMVCRNIELEARLIDDMLDLTRITRGKLKLQLTRADVHELLRHALEIVRSETEDRHLDVTLALEAARHQLVLDAPRLQQVFWNLFRNAYKFAPTHGAISVRSRNPTPDTIAIEISDNGIGIERQFLQKIFDAFEQVDTRREGLGLGLAISKAIIEMHGGKISAHSEGLGKGATFAIEMPIAGNP
jgi:two-component system cell cycle sensor histidine kinase/response regulator CckA